MVKRRRRRRAFHVLAVRVAVHLRCCFLLHSLFTSWQLFRPRILGLECDNVGVTKVSEIKKKKNINLSSAVVHEQSNPSVPDNRKIRRNRRTKNREMLSKSMRNVLRPSIVGQWILPETPKRLSRNQMHTIPVRFSRPSQLILFPLL